VADQGASQKSERGPQQSRARLGNPEIANMSRLIGFPSCCLSYRPSSSALPGHFCCMR
jgi:hypothetical protein